MGPYHTTLCVGRMGEWSRSLRVDEVVCVAFMAKPVQEVVYSGADPGIHPNYYRTVWNVGHSGIPARTTVPELIRHKFISTKGCLA